MTLEWTPGAEELRTASWDAECPADGLGAHVSVRRATRMTVTS